MKFLFIDAEFTGEHAEATLVSLGLVGVEGESLYVTFNDYARDQVTPWLEENVLSVIDETTSVSRAEGWRIVSEWIDVYSDGERISLVSAGKMLDLMLLFELWREADPNKPFHHLHSLPPCLNHAAHFDLPTVFFLAGLAPDSDRQGMIDSSLAGHRHEALYDARVVRECFLKCFKKQNFPNVDEPLFESV